jgi:outer membrane lipoprotein-sorting protein
MVAISGCGEKAREPERKRSAPASPAEEALVSVADRYADLDSFSERTQITKTVADAEGQETTVHQTELSLRRPNRIFYQMTGEDTTVIACNGERLIVYSSAQGGYVEDDPPENLNALVRDHHADAIGVDELLLLAGSDPLEALDNVAAAEGDAIGGQPMQLLQGTIKQVAQDESAEGPTATQFLYVGSEDGLVHKVVTQIKRGEAVLRTEEVMEGPAANPTIPDGRFEYQPPADAENLTPD